MAVVHSSHVEDYYRAPRWRLTTRCHGYITADGSNEGWFRLVLDGSAAREARPKTFTPKQLQSVKVPVLLILGKKDNLVGDPEKVKQLARNVPDIQIEVLNTGHAIWIEQPDSVNALINEFFGQP